MYPFSRGDVECMTHMLMSLTNNYIAWFLIYPCHSLIKEVLSVLLLLLPLFFFNTFWPHSAAFGILVPGPGIEPEPAAMEARSPNHWTSREVPSPTFKRGN